MTDTQQQIGQLLPPTAQRDAIHIAVAPVVAAQPLLPGAPITVTANGNAMAAPDAAIGIVDPFLPGPVQPGDRFYMFLLPNTITSLRHEWTHPAFDTINKRRQSQWLKVLANGVGFAYDEETHFSCVC